jgi:hypothetical protein
MAKIILVKSIDDLNSINIKEYDIIGVDNDTLVDLIKNDYNNLNGLIPKSLWDLLVYEKTQDEKTQKAEKTQKTQEDFDDVFSRFGDIFDDVTKSKEFKKTKGKAQDKKTQYEEGFDNFFDDVFSKFGEVFDDVTKSKEFKKTKEKAEYIFDDGIKTSIKFIDIQTIKIKIARLKNLKETAIEENVHSKKFIERVNKKIQNLEIQLELLGN